MDRDALIKEAITMANEIGLINLTRSELCERAGIKDGSFFGIAECTFGELMDEIKPYAPITVQGVALTRERLSPELRRDYLLGVALEMAEDNGGYLAVSVKALAEKAGVSIGLVNTYFYNRVGLHRAMMKKAVEEDNLQIIAQGVINRDVTALRAPKELQELALQRVALV